MSQTLLVLAAFIIALGIGIFIGKIVFSAQSQSEKSGLEERINGLLNQMEQLKIQFQTERNQFEKSFAQLSSEEKNRISHRGRALDRLKEVLYELFS